MYGYSKTVSLITAAAVCMLKLTPLAERSVAENWGILVRNPK
jgi:hypothetical protein